jgi:hypothetical protein
MASLAQDQVFQDICRASDDWFNGDKRRKASSWPTVSKKLKDLYNPTLQSERHFYSQDETGLPVAKVLTTVVTPHHACRLELTDTLNPADRSTTPTPAGYSGNVCPPTIVADLLGHPSAREYCVKCEKKTEMYLQLLQMAADARNTLAYELNADEDG